MEICLLFLKPVSQKKIKSNKIGLFHCFADELKLLLLIMAKEDAPTTRKGNPVYISKHHDTKHSKEDLSKEHLLWLSIDFYNKCSFDRSSLLCFAACCFEIDTR